MKARMTVLWCRMTSPRMRLACSRFSNSASALPSRMSYTHASHCEGITVSGPMASAVRKPSRVETSMEVSSSAGSARNSSSSFSSASVSGRSRSFMDALPVVPMRLAVPEQRPVRPGSWRLTFRAEAALGKSIWQDERARASRASCSAFAALVHPARRRCAPCAERRAPRTPFSIRLRTARDAPRALTPLRLRSLSRSATPAPGRARLTPGLALCLVASRSHALSRHSYIPVHHSPPLLPLRVTDRIKARAAGHGCPVCGLSRMLDARYARGRSRHPCLPRHLHILVHRMPRAARPPAGGTRRVVANFALSFASVPGQPWPGNATRASLLGALLIEQFRGKAGRDV